MDKTISMANNRFFIFFVSSSGCIASASTPGKPAVDLLRRFLRPARNKGNLVPPQILLADLPGTHRTAAAFVAGAGVDHGFPHVVLRAPPPHLLVASLGDHGRGQGSVQDRVPRLGQLGVPGRQVVEPRQDLPPGAVGAVAPPGPGADGRVPAVPQAAPPPDGAVAIR